MEQSQNSLTWSVLIEGLVQNVGYRRFAQRAAQGFNLKGWTRNLSNGQVEVRVTGPKEKIDLFIDNLLQGPPGSNVKNVKVETLPICEEFPEFTIRRE